MRIAEIVVSDPVFLAISVYLDAVFRTNGISIMLNTTYSVRANMGLTKGLRRAICVSKKIAQGKSKTKARKACGVKTK